MIQTLLRDYKNNRAFDQSWIDIKSRLSRTQTRNCNLLIGQPFRWLPQDKTAGLLHFMG